MAHICILDQCRTFRYAKGNSPLAGTHKPAGMPAVKALAQVRGSLDWVKKRRSPVRWVVLTGLQEVGMKKRRQNFIPVALVIKQFLCHFRKERSSNEQAEEDLH